MCQMGKELWWVSGLTPLLTGHAAWLASSPVATHHLAVLPGFSMHTCDHQWPLHSSPGHLRNMHVSTHAPWAPGPPGTLHGPGSRQVLSLILPSP